MPFFTEVRGDIVDYAKSGEYNVLVHGCNCFCVMGAGVAKAIVRAFPEALSVDRNTTIRGDRSKLGTMSIAETSTGLSIVNAYTQYAYGRRNAPNLDYQALQSCFRQLNKHFHQEGTRFLIPKIGAGLAGGDWNKIAHIIETEMAGRDVTLVLY